MTPDPGPAGAGPLAGRAERYRPGRALLMSLLAGRATYRMTWLVATVLLLPVWGEERYNRYAAALATFSWVIVLVFAGPEKTFLKLLPRSPRTAPDVIAAVVAVAWWLPIPLVGAFGLAWGMRGEEAGPTVYLGVAAMQLSVGCTLLLVGLHRAIGRPRADAASLLVMSAGLLVLLGASAAGWLGPSRYVAAVIALQLAINLTLSARLGRPSLRIRQRPRFLVGLGVTALWLSGTDLFMFGGTAVLVVMLTASEHSDQVGRLYALSLLWSAGVALLTYLLRVYAPHTSLRLMGAAGATGRERAARMARQVTAWHLVWLAATVAAMAGGLTAVDSPTGQVVVWAVLLAARAPSFALLLGAAFLLENSDATAPRVVGAAAVTGMVVATLVGLVVVPATGGVGVIVALGAGELAYAVVVAGLGRPGPPRRLRRALPGAPRPAGLSQPAVTAQAAVERPRDDADTGQA